MQKRVSSSILTGGLGGGGFGALAALETDLAGLSAQDGAEGDAGFLGMEDGVDEGAEFGDGGAFEEVEQGIAAVAAEGDFAEGEAELRAEGAGGALDGAPEGGVDAEAGLDHGDDEVGEVGEGAGDGGLAFGDGGLKGDEGDGGESDAGEEDGEAEGPAEAGGEGGGEGDDSQGDGPEFDGEEGVEARGSPARRRRCSRSAVRVVGRRLVLAVRSRWRAGRPTRVRKGRARSSSRVVGSAPLSGRSRRSRRSRMRRLGVAVARL